ncbi:MAG: Gfo/Idh/MocA family oxidoreductase [Gemmatimonadota bacterium]
MKLRIGIVGAGANTRSRHLPGFQKIDGVDVVAVCNRSRASGQKAADEFGIPRVFDRWEDLVRSDGVDAVCIGTWPYLHCPVALAALAAGKHVLTEARMAMNLEEARRMAAAASQSDRVAMVVPAPFFLETEPRLLAMVADGYFGDFLEIHVTGLGGGYDPGAPLHWRQRRDLSGNNIMALGILNETVRRYVGHERSVVAQAQIFTAERRDPETGRRLPADVPESLGVVAAMACGATAVYHVSSVAAHGAATAIEMHGSRGALRLAGAQALVVGQGDADWRVLEVPAGERGGWRVEEDFVEAIREGAPVTHTSFADGVRYMEFTEAVNLSLREGRRVDLPLP